MVRTAAVNLLNLRTFLHNMLWPICCVDPTYMVRTADPTKNSQPDGGPLRGIQSRLDAIQYEIMKGGTSW